MSEPGSQPLPEPQERFASLRAAGEKPADAYRKAGIGSLGLSVPVVIEATAMRVTWLRTHFDELLSNVEAGLGEILSLGFLNDRSNKRQRRQLELAQFEILLLLRQLRR